MDASFESTESATTNSTFSWPIAGYFVGHIGSSAVVGVGFPLIFEDLDRPFVFLCTSVLVGGALVFLDLPAVLLSWALLRNRDRLRFGPAWLAAFGVGVVGPPLKFGIVVAFAIALGLENQHLLPIAVMANFVAVALLVTMATKAMAQWGKLYLPPPGKCTQCGYDLRGSPAGGDCPECGAGGA